MELLCQYIEGMFYKQLLAEAHTMPMILLKESSRDNNPFF